MKKNGFTLVELLGVLIILSLLIVITVPAFTGAFNSIKRENYNSKVTEIEIAAAKYGSLIKDEVKDAGDSCLTTNVDFLIQKGYLMSEDDYKNAIYNPTNGEELNDSIYICYSLSKFDIEVFYAKDFDESKYYYKSEVVRHNDKFYRCVIDYPAKDGILGTNSDGKRYFEEIVY